MEIIWTVLVKAGAQRGQYRYKTARRAHTAADKFDANYGAHCAIVFPCDASRPMGG